MALKTRFAHWSAILDVGYVNFGTASCTKNTVFATIARRKFTTMVAVLGRQYEIFIDLSGLLGVGFLEVFASSNVHASQVGRPSSHSGTVFPQQLQ